MVPNLLDDLLAAPRFGSAVFSRMTMCGDWGYAKDPLKGAPFHLLLVGSAVVEDDEGRCVELQPGDLVVVPLGGAHRLLSRRDAPAEPWRTIVEAQGWTPWRPGTRFKAIDLRLGTGDPTATLISGVFDFGDPRRHPLLEALPPLLRLSGAEAPPASRVPLLIRLLEAEILSGAPGAEPIVLWLADMLFVQALRQHLASPAELRGWLRGLTTPDLAPAVAAVHRDPGAGWTLRSLAGTANMSRSRFAARFKQVVGTTPLDFVTEQRMFVAAGLLDRGVARAAVASRVGYSSAIAFSKAFQRWAGMKPSEYRGRSDEQARAAQEAWSQNPE